MPPWCDTSREQYKRCHTNTAAICGVMAASGYILMCALRVPDSSKPLGVAVHTSLPIMDIRPYYPFLAPRIACCSQERSASLTRSFDQLICASRVHSFDHHISWSIARP